MPLWNIVCRTVAVAVLLLTGVELVACELAPAATCEIAGIPDDDGNSKTGDDDSCLCCCFHIVVSSQFELAPTIDSAPAFAVSQSDPPSPDARHIYHPPRV